MLLLSRPPYLRWVAAGVVIVGALLWEMSGTATEPFPFAAVEIPRGEQILEDDITWINIPSGTLTMPDLAMAMADTTIRSGDPITASVVSAGSQVPTGWWSVPVVIPTGLSIGTGVRLTFLDGSSVDGVVSQPASEDDYGTLIAGTVAVPEAVVETVAIASATDALIVVIAPTAAGGPLEEEDG